jgi:hypothetical protein
VLVYVARFGKDRRIGVVIVLKRTSRFRGCGLVSWLRFLRYL